VDRGAVHGPPYQECRWLVAWFLRYEPWVSARAALAGTDIRGRDAGWLLDFAFGLFIEIGLTEKGEKRLEWIHKVIYHSRPEPTVIDNTRSTNTGLPSSVGAPVNEE
jgi:hypothetical protein